VQEASQNFYVLEPPPVRHGRRQYFRRLQTSFLWRLFFSWLQVSLKTSRPMASQERRGEVAAAKRASLHCTDGMEGYLSGDPEKCPGGYH
jgi:hypothetical protein